MVLATWYHDAVYDPRAGDNEARSADLARRDLTGLGVGADRVDRVAGLVLATRDHRAADPDAAVLVDADLAILAVPAGDYAAYVAAVRAEYGFVPEAAWRAGRAAVLAGFLARPRLFATATQHAARRRGGPCQPRRGARRPARGVTGGRPRCASIGGRTGPRRRRAAAAGRRAGSRRRCGAPREGRRGRGGAGGQRGGRGGVEVCFANPGTTELPLVRALDAVPGIRPVLGLFEGVCTGAADGWGRLRGAPALTLLHLGPGLANGLANLHNARRARTPVVNLVGDMATWHRAADAPLTSDIASLAAGGRAGGPRGGRRRRPPRTRPRRWARRAPAWCPP